MERKIEITKIDFEVGDIFEINNDKLYECTGVIHDKFLIYGVPINSCKSHLEEEEFAFESITDVWLKMEI